MGLDVPFVHLPVFVPRVPDESDRVGAVNEDPYFLFVGRLETIKGPQTLLPVFKRFNRARLVIAGAGEAEAELRNRQQIVPYRVSGLPRTDRATSLYHARSP